MYAIEATRDATDRLWQGLARAFRAAGVEDVPDRLERTLGADRLWRHPDLLLAQTCGYPFTHALAGRVRLVATPRYRAPGCDGPSYASLIVVRADDPGPDLVALSGRGRVAINDPASHSGHHALKAALAAEGVGGRAFRMTLITGSHLASLEAVSSGQAEVAAIDGVIFGLMQRHAPERLEGLRVIGTTPSAPGLPLITARSTAERDLERLRDGLQAALADPDLESARDALLLEGVEVLPVEAYERILEIERLGAPVELPEPDRPGRSVDAREICKPGFKH